ncbi:MAG TPA: hypothetical protein DCZ11_08700 [Gammaproteobacteria bacterium]|nr:hypothetical protein [Gammaproteobacteria bacterium]MCH78509.1 hypothetical protein [Gammaproteobacteria bacterium]
MNAPEQPADNRHQVRSGRFMDLPAEQVNGDRYIRRMVEGVHHMVCIVEAEPGWVTQQHDHHNDETLYILRGQMTVIVAGEEHVLNAGDFIYLPPDVPHKGVVGPEGMTQLKVFSPPRQDYIEKTDAYLRNA